MSEYMEIDAEVDEDNPLLIHFYTNLALSPAGESPQEYNSYEEMEEGSALVQTLTIIEGIERLVIDGEDMTITRTADTPEHGLIADISAAIKDFFL